MGAIRSILLLFVCLSFLSFAQRRDHQRRTAVKKPAGETVNIYGANDFSMPSLDGGVLRLSSFAGRIVLVTIFSPSCAPCISETRDLRSVYQDYHGRGFEILGVGVQTGESELRAFVEKQALRWPVGINDTVPRQFGMYGLPDHYLFGRDGALVNHFIGYLRSPLLRSALDTLMDTRSRSHEK